jgi:ribokinase
VVNEEEAAHFLGRRVDDLLVMQTAILELHDACQRVIVTMGAAGSILSTPDGVTMIPVRPVTAVDTTGAGDAYVAAVASGPNDGSDEVGAARIAATVAAMATRSVGAQTSMPKAEDVQDDPVRA